MPRILVAEDEANLAQPVIERFAGIGHEVHWVRAVREVRAELPSWSPDLLILDTTLDTDGLELLQAIRLAPEPPPAGVVRLPEPGAPGPRDDAPQVAGGQ